MDYGKRRELEFTVHGKPKSKRTGKISTKGRFPRIIKNPETELFENLVNLSFKSKYPTFRPEQKAVRIEIKAFFKPPSNLSKKKQLRIIGDDYPICKKPDCSNISKAVEDGLNGIAFYDDRFVIDLNCRKFYSDNERTEIRIIIFDELEII